MNKAFSPLFQASFFTCLSLIISNSVLAQSISSDGTLPTPTEVNSTEAGVEIKGGTTRGGNLFHSFKDFSVPTGSEAFFNNAASVVNILNRVTGGNISNIDGLLRANGSANLFLINPAGIVFGQGASLKIGGSFYGSTADSILFPDGVEFSATDTQTEPILTINAPIGLNFRDDPQPITNRSNFELTKTVLDETVNPTLAGTEFTILDSVGLEVNPGKTIALIGGNVFLENASGITAPGGRVELGGLSQGGAVRINNDGSLTFPDGIARADVSLTGQSRVKVAANGGGFINVNARNLSISDSSQLLAGIAENMGSATAQAGDITINATDSVNLLGKVTTLPTEPEASNIAKDTATGIRNNVGLSYVFRNNASSKSNAQGNSGNIVINTGSLRLNNLAILDTSLFGKGNAGDIRINADNISFDLGLLLNEVRGVNLKTIKEQGNGTGGEININAESFIFNNGSSIQADLQEGVQGQGGNIVINVQGKTSLSNLSSFNTQIQKDAKGNGGSIEINTGSLFLDNSFLVSNTKGIGNAGNITINASDQINLENISGLISEVGEGEIGSNAVGNAGNINITTSSLTLQGLNFIVSKTFGRGNAGNINIAARDRIVIDGGLVNTQAETNSIGNGGNINIKTGSIIVKTSSPTPSGNYGLLLADTKSQGNAGSIKIDAQKEVSLDTALFLAQVQENAVGNAGNIEISADSISLNNFSLVSTNSKQGSVGQAGNIVLNAKNLNIDNGSTVDALTENGFDGGNITIKANNLNLTATGKIITSTKSTGNAGNINLDIASEITLDGSQTKSRPENLFPLDEESLNQLETRTGLFASTSKSATGNGGTIDINTTNQVAIANNSLISVNSQGKGNGGNVNIEAKDISFDNNALISAATASGEGGNIAFQAGNIILKDNSSISAQASGEADGGNINIDTDFIVAFPNQNNDIIANAQQGSGGNIAINAQSVFGLEERPLNDLTSDINASSELGLNGNININTPDVDPFQETREAPENIVEQDEVVAGVCDANQTAQDIMDGTTNSFVVNGKGGIPPTPIEPFSAETLLIKGKSIVPNGELQSNSPVDQERERALQAQYPPIMTDQGPIYPARGILKKPDGTVILTAYPTNNTQRIPSNSSNCGIDSRTKSN